MHAFLGPALLAFLSAPLNAVQGGALINLSPSQPRVDSPVTFTLSAAVPITMVTWDFGDGALPSPGGAVAVHSYATPGSYVVRAVYDSNKTTATVLRPITVVEVRRISYIPSLPVTGKEVTFTAQDFLSSAVRWAFGDDTPPVIGKTVQPHIYVHPGTYTVAAQDLTGAAKREFRTQLTVRGQGPSAPFAISFLALRWEDGTTDLSVRKDDPGPVAYADLKFEGTGMMQAQWMVDGRILQTFAGPLGFAGVVTLNSGSSLGGANPETAQFPLPTNLLGEHFVTLNVLSPSLGFQAPVLRYFVSLAGEPPPPVLLSVRPASARAGEEIELALSGRGFTPEMKLDFGRDVALVAPIRVLSPTRAWVKVFVAPSAKPGSRILQSLHPRRGDPRTAKFKILPLRK